MAAVLGVARRTDCGRNGCVFPVVRSSMPARTAAVPREGLGDPREARATAHARALSHQRHPLVRCGGPQPGRTALDSALGGRCVLWRTFRIGLDVDPVPWAAHRQQRIATRPHFDAE